MKIYATRKLFQAGILPHPPATQDIGALAERLRALRLMFAADHLIELVSRSVKEVWNSAQFLDELLRLELERQEERRVTQAIRISHLPSGPTISNFDFAYQPSVSRNQIETLSTCQWIRDCQCLLLQGPPGVGKTHLCVALGTRAIENGFSVSFYRVDELMHQLKRDGDLHPSQLKHRKYMALNLTPNSATTKCPRGLVLSMLANGFSQSVRVDITHKRRYTCLLVRWRQKKVHPALPWVQV